MTLGDTGGWAEYILWYYNEKDVSVDGWCLAEVGKEIKLDEMNKKLMEDLGDECVKKVGDLISDGIELKLEGFSMEVVKELKESLMDETD